MEYLFIAFSNSQEDPLPNLVEEDTAIYNLLLPREKAGHFKIHRDSHTTRERLIQNLVELKDDLLLFHFSGHAGEQLIYLDDEKAHGPGLRDLLNQCPKLKVIILNGCATSDQAHQLATLASKPIIIATHAPVGDRTATEFSKALYQVLAQQYGNISEAFEVGIGAAGTHRAQPMEVHRGSYVPKALRQLWGLFSPSQADLSWTLPRGSNGVTTAAWEPNQHLIQSLIEAFAPHRSECQKILDTEAAGGEVGLVKKRLVILKSLPHPVSEQLRKLMVPDPQNSQFKFYDQLGIDRLKQLHVSFQTVVELICYVLLAQLWDHLNEEGSPIPDGLEKLLRDLFLKDQSRQEAKHLFAIVCQTKSFLVAHKVDFFMAELQAMDRELQPSSELGQLCQYFDDIHQKLVVEKNMTREAAEQNCIDAEKKLAHLVSKLAFIINYTVVSVKDIDVINFKHYKKPIFKHRLIKLVQTFVGLESEDEILENFLDNSSVLLMGNGSEQKRYLNLSPFVFDENAFREKSSEDAKLRFFQNYIQARDVYWFKHVYKPYDSPLEVDEHNLTAIKKQFDALAQSLFNGPMDQLA